MSSNPSHNEVIQHYDIKCGRSRFSPGTPVACTNKTDRHGITEIFLEEVTLDTMTPIPIKNTYVRRSQVLQLSILMKGRISVLK